MKIFKCNSFLTLISGFSLAMAFCLNSCGDDDEPDYNTPPTTTTLTAPTGCRGEVVSNGVSLSWNSVEAAEFYLVSRATSVNGEQIVLGYIGNSGRIYNTTVIDTNPKEGDNYYFIQACNNAYGNTYSAGPESAPIYVYYVPSDMSGDNSNDSDKPSTPTGVKAVLNGSEIVVSWNASKNADSYLVRYTKPGSTQEFETYREQTSVTYNFNPMPQGTYTFYVIAIRTWGDLIFSDASETVSVYYAGGGNSGGGNSGGGNSGGGNSGGGNSGGGNSGGGNSGGGNSGETTPSQLETPTGLQVNSLSSDSYVQLQCNAVTLGYQYELYRSKSATSGYSKVSASIGANASGSIIYFTDSNPLSGTSYYKVKAIALPGLGIKDSNFSNYVTVTR